MPVGPLRTYGQGAFSVASLLDVKAAQGVSTSLVLPARNEEQTVASVVSAFVPLRSAGLLDEIVVVDSLSTDGTVAVACAAGATVVGVQDAYPELEAVRGKGEAMWRGLHATTGDLVVFCDADVLDAGPHFATGLLGPLLAEPQVQLVKGFYRRPIVDREGHVEEHGGRVTELTARPFLSLFRPELAQFVQPLAGEWAGRRSHLESLPFPTGYGVEIAVLLDTYAAVGLAGMAQSDLGRRTHSHQSQQALGVMAAEVLGTALRRLGVEPVGEAMRQYTLVDHTRIDSPLAFIERPPVRSVRG
jgi:glucosyl-3-phosphoglycerate synthase